MCKHFACFILIIFTNVTLNKMSYMTIREKKIWQNALYHLSPMKTSELAVVTICTQMNSTVFQ